MTKNVKNRLLAAAAVFAGASAMTAAVVPAGPDSTGPEPLSDTLCLRKMALDLTYRSPTDEEIAELRAGKVDLAGMADAYLASPEFEAVVFDWYRAKFPPTELTEEAGDVDLEEPARIARHIVLSDMDFRLLLTGDFTVTPEGEAVPATNGPPAGIISTRYYMSAHAGNYRRNWAGHFLHEWTPLVLKAVSLPPAAEETDFSPETILADPACAGCHGNEFFGLDYLAPFSFCYGPDGVYTPDCTAEGRFLGTTGASLPELGAAVTDSNEFMASTVNFFFRKLFNRSMAYEERAFYVGVVTQFREAGYQVRSLLKSLVTSPEYCAR